MGYSPWGAKELDMTEQLHFHFSQSWKGMEPGVTLRSVWSKPCVSGQRQDTSQTQIASLVAWTVKRLPTMRETRVQSLGWEDPLEKEMATHSSIHAWKIPWTEEPGELQSMESQRVAHD